MIGIDTNILLRYLTQDDPRQSPVANRLLEKTLNPESPGFISIVAIAETVWTLQRHFGLMPRQVSEQVHTLAVQPNLVIQHEDQVLFALSAVEKGFGFADALAFALGEAAGCTHTLTFDRKASRLPGMELI